MVAITFLPPDRVEPAHAGAGGCREVARSSCQQGCGELVMLRLGVFSSGAAKDRTQLVLH
jgi:hypothetical protein